MRKIIAIRIDNQVRHFEVVIQPGDRFPDFTELYRHASGGVLAKALREAWGNPIYDYSRLVVNDKEQDAIVLALGWRFSRSRAWSRAYDDAYVGKAHNEALSHVEVQAKPDGDGLVWTVPNPLLVGAWVSIYLAEAQGLDASGGKYVTVCEAHGTICNHETRAKAQSHVEAVDWCEECQALDQGEWK
jgi:hypothetical protein